MDGFGPATKIDLQSADEKICFSITDCSLDKKYSFWSLNKNQATALLKQLNHIEKLTWKQFSNLSRQNGITPEKPGTPNFNIIDEESTAMENITEKYYFHFRVKKTGLFRVFGYQKKQFFCITHIDPDGRINH